MVKQNNLKTIEDFAKLVVADGLELDTQSNSFNQEYLDTASTSSVLLARAKEEMTIAEYKLFDESNAASRALSDARDALQVAYVSKNESKFDARAEFSDWAIAFAASAMKRGADWESYVGDDIPKESVAWINALKADEAARAAWHAVSRS
jgi:hypothetical protein